MLLLITEYREGRYLTTTARFTVHGLNSRVGSVEGESTALRARAGMYLRGLGACQKRVEILSTLRGHNIMVAFKAL